MKRRFVLYASWAFFMAFPLSVYARSGAENGEGPAVDPAALPPPRMIVSTPEPERARRVVDLQYNDEKMRICTDSWQLTSSRAEIHPGEPVVFRVRSSRKCDGQRLSAPAAETAVFTVRSVRGRNSASDVSETIHPNASSYSFTHSFDAAGSYQVTVQNRLDSVEVHTVSFVVAVSEPEVHVVQPEITE